MEVGEATKPEIGSPEMGVAEDPYDAWPIGCAATTGVIVCAPCSCPLSGATAQQIRRSRARAVSLMMLLWQHLGGVGVRPDGSWRKLRATTLSISGPYSEKG
jgi:hypothetical protein